MEGTNMLSGYEERLRDAEMHDRLAVNLDKGRPSAGSSLGRLRKAVTGIFKKVAR